MLFKKWTLFIVGCLSVFVSSLSAASDTFWDYQNYNHGYCADCNCYPCQCELSPMDPPPAAAPVPDPCCGVPQSPPPAPCDPCAPVCGAECGVSLCAIAVAAVAVGVAIVIIAASGVGSGSSPRN